MANAPFLSNTGLTGVANHDRPIADICHFFADSIASALFLPRGAYQRV
jgi:hypothetical protein